MQAHMVCKWQFTQQALLHSTIICSAAPNALLTIFGHKLRCLVHNGPDVRRRCDQPNRVGLSVHDMLQASKLGLWQHAFCLPHSHNGLSAVLSCSNEDYTTEQSCGDGIIKLRLPACRQISRRSPDAMGLTCNHGHN